jgi:hypothetical protein
MLAVPVLALATAPALPQQPQRQPPSQGHAAPAGLPLFTSDGKAIGRVIASGIDEDNEAVLVAEIEQPLGIGPKVVAIPNDMFARRADRIELTITEAEVNARLGR